MLDKKRGYDMSACPCIHTEALIHTDRHSYQYTRYHVTRTTSHANMTTPPWNPPLYGPITNRNIYVILSLSFIGLFEWFVVSNVNHFRIVFNLNQFWNYLLPLWILELVCTEIFNHIALGYMGLFICVNFHIVCFHTIFL